MTIKTLNLSTIVPISISGAYYQKIQALLLFLSSLITKEEFIDCCNKIKAGDTNLYKTNPIYFHIQIILELVNEVENTAIKQELVSDIEIKPSKSE